MNVWEQVSVVIFVLDIYVYLSQYGLRKNI